MGNPPSPIPPPTHTPHLQLQEVWFNCQSAIGPQVLRKLEAVDPEEEKQKPAPKLRDKDKAFQAYRARGLRVWRVSFPFVFFVFLLVGGWAGGWGVMVGLVSVSGLLAGWPVGRPAGWLAGWLFGDR